MATFITGATGFVGLKLLDQLENVSICSRDATRAKDRLGDRIVEAIQWDPAQEELDLGDRTFTNVINLMGEPIAEGRWTKEKKRRIRESRVTGTRRLAEALLRLPEPPKCVVSASAVGIYGDGGEQRLTEDGPHGEGFLTDVCEQWEASTQPLVDAGVRVIHLRIGIILGREGGALASLIPVFKWGVGGKLGNGKQWVPWIHVDDVVGLIVWCTRTNSIAGPVNAASPNPVRNQELTKKLAKHLKRPAVIPVPKFGLRLVLGEFADSLFFSQKVIPQAANEHGYEFQFATLDPALDDLI